MEQSHNLRLVVLALLVPLAALLMPVASADAKGKQPDLVVTSVSAPVSVDVGTPFKVEDVVKNIGKKRAKESKVTYSLSSSASPGSDDAVSLGTRSVPKLKPRKKSAGTATLKTTAKPGDYFLLACASGKSKEKSTRNNCKASSRLAVVDPTKPTTASLGITPANGALPSTLVGSASSPTTFTVTNDGGGTSGPISGQFGAAPFSSVPASDQCTGKTLAPGGSCTFSIVFAPTARGPAQSQVSVQADPGGTASSPLSGTGLAPASISISDSSGPNPVSWNFGTAVVGSDASAHTFNITNNGDASTGALTAGLTGPNSGDFVVSGGTCVGAGALAGGSTCTVIANFHPASGGTKQATLGVSGSPGGSVSTGLTGQGQTAATLVANPILHNYGGVPFNSFRDFTFQLFNTGQASTSAITLSIGGDDASRFQILAAGDTCSGQTLSGGANCSFTVRFTPGNIGSRSAFVNFSAAQGGPGSAPLSGSGT